MPDIAMRTQKKMPHPRYKLTKISWLISTECKKWEAEKDSRTCPKCRLLDGKVVSCSFLPLLSFSLRPPLHPLCRCSLIKVPLVFAGIAVYGKTAEASWDVSYHGTLPRQCIAKPVEKILESIPWQKNIPSIAIGRSIKGDKFAKLIQKPPTKSARVWHEADLQYNDSEGRPERLLYSNDGLFFATYDRNQTVIIIMVDETVTDSKKKRIHTEFTAVDSNRKERE